MESSMAEEFSKKINEAVNQGINQATDNIMQLLACVFSQPITYVVIGILILYVVGSIIHKRRKKF